jgi:hypothetical protein
MNTNQQTSEDFLLSEGGPFHKALVKMNLYNKQGKLALVSLCISWLPLVIITAIEGTLYSGTQLPFLQDVAMQARVLVALPMLIMIKLAIDSKVIAVAKYLSDALMSPEERQLILTTALRRAKKLTSSALTEILLLLIVIGATISFVKSGAYSALETGTTSWMTSSAEGNQTLSVAGYWAIIISIPIFQFLLLRWLWRYFVWMLLLFRLSKAKLNLLPTHADRAGGLGIIMLAQRSFNLIFVAGSVVISGQFIAQLLDHPDSFNTIKGEAIAYIVICIVFILIPLLFFTGKLFKTKNEGLLHLSNLGATLSRKFEREWVNDLPIEKRIEEQQVDPSMVYDYSGIYDSVQQLRTIPVTPRDIIGMGLTLFVPFIPILFIHFSVGELLQRIVGLLA